MNRTIATPSAPAAIGPYSQAVLVEQPTQTLYCSGQVGLDPATMKIVEGGVEAEARCVMKNLTAVLGAAGMQMTDIVKATIYLVDMADYPKVNAIYAEHFAGKPPARVAVAVAALPAGAQVEIDAIAVK
ncbi:MAG: Rid family detoxifying hydrolase [Deltaproteobacteria bacterium]|jgi:2-iminobutanoate/2-iminopropanoate deaminase